MAIFRCRYLGSFTGGDTWSVSLHVQSSTATASSVLTAWNGFINSFVGTTLKPLWSPYVSGSETVVDLLDEATGKPSAQVRGTAAQTGTGAAATQINQRNALVTGLRSSLPTKGGRGRIYWPPVTNAALDANGLIPLATRTSVANACWNGLKAMATTATPTIYHRPVWNYTVKPPVLIEAGTHTDINGVTVGQVLGTQRRRSNKVANNFFLANG